MDVLGNCQPVVPVVLVGATEDPEVLFQGLVSSFALSIGLRMVCGAYVLLDSQHLA